MASRLTPVQIELGGKDPVYVCDDVNLAVAAAGIADGAFYNNGQSCCSVERIYVHEAIAEDFVAKFVETVEGFSQGDPTDPATYLGPIARPAHFEVLEEQIADALSKGARIRTGGHRVGAWFEPTVLTDVTAEMAVMREETFGPVIGIQVVRDDEEAAALMNDSDYGLTAGVYTTDETRAHAILATLAVGSAYWNCCDRVSPRLPWSGRGNSGMGLTLSTYGFLTFVQPKAWHLRQA